MGDRANIVVKSSGEQVSLYTHWEGSELPWMLQRALARGRERWSDSSYLARIIFCDMIRNSIMDLTGFGISQNPAEGHVIVVDVDKQMIFLYEKNPMTFEEFMTVDLNMVLDN